MDIEKLIERLRNNNIENNCHDCALGYYAFEAATALSTLQAENTQLKEKLEALRQDRDAIEQDFRAFAKQWWEEDSGFPCRWCKFENSGGCEWKAKQPNEEKICAGRAFEWRGPKKD